MKKFYFFFTTILSIAFLHANESSNKILDNSIAFNHSACLFPIITGNFSICLPGPNTTQLTGSGIPSPTNPWTSSNPGVATVNSSGLVTAISFGSTTITYFDNLGSGISENVYVSTFPTITAPNGTSTCQAGIIQLEGSLFPNANLPWESLNPSIATVDNFGLVTGVSPGVANILYRNLGGCTRTIPITIKPLLMPIVSCGTATSTSITFNWNAVPGASTYVRSYRINGGPFISAGNGPSQTYTFNGLTPGDIVDLYVVPSGIVGVCFQVGFTSCTTNINCNENNIPVAPVVTLIEPTCINPTGSIAVVGVAGITFSINRGPYTASPIYDGLPPGSTHSLSAKNTTGCISNATAITISNQLSNPGTITLTSSPVTAFQSVCSNTSITPVAFTIGNGATGASLISGSLPTGVNAIFSAGVLTISGTALEAGTFQYTVATTGGCGTETLTAVIVVNAVIESVYCDASQTTTPNSVYFDWQSIPGATIYNYSYSIGAGPIITGTTPYSHLEVFDVLPGQLVSFTVADNQTACQSSVQTTCTALSNEDFQTDAFQYSPNPFYDILNIKLAQPITNIQIFNLLGQQVFASDFNEKEIQINLSHLNSGTYLVKINAGDSIKAFKIVKN